MLLIGFYRPILTLSMRAFGPRNSAYAFLDHDRHTDIYIYIYHAKSRLNTPVWGSLRSPNYSLWNYSTLWTYSWASIVNIASYDMIWLNYISGQTTGLDHRSECSFPFWQCSLSWQWFPVGQWSIPKWYRQWSSSPRLSTSWQWFLAFLIIVHNTVHTLIFMLLSFVPILLYE